jgi:putative polyketide hydroxylase
MNPVIVVGAGPVGLGCALELARFGVRSVLVEKHASTSWHPKTRNFNTRTMEIARGWGLPVYQRLRGIDTPPGWKSPIRFLRSAIGEELGTIDSKGFEGPGAAVSPALPVMSSQDYIEQILLDAVYATGLVDVRFDTEVTDLLTGGEAGDRDAVVWVRSRTDGHQETLTGPALVAADGADSMVRTRLGIEREGHLGLRHLVNCYFRADIEGRIGDRRGVLFFVNNDNAQGVLQPLDGRGRWLCQISVDQGDWSLETYTKDRAVQWIRAAVGIDDLDVELVSIGLWQLNATVAERLVQGRVVLCGDAAHQFPPTGGIGLNTGVQGMHNVMWKLAAHVRGQAGWALVSTYDQERRSVAARARDQSLQNSINVIRIGQAAADGGDSGLTPQQIIAESRRYGNHLGVEFGATYRSSAVVEDGTLPPEVDDDFSDYVPSATPGCRAPHVWLGHADGRVSTLDLIGDGFLVLAGGRGQAWVTAARDAARNTGVAVSAYLVGAVGLDDDGPFASAYGIGEHGAVLVRPDGHVGWRSAEAPGTGTEIADALRRVLSTDPVTADL